MNANTNAPIAADHVAGELVKHEALRLTPPAEKPAKKLDAKKAAPAKKTSRELKTPHGTQNQLPARKASSKKSPAKKAAPKEQIAKTTPATETADVMTRGQRGKLVRSYKKFGNQTPSEHSLERLYQELSSAGVKIMRSKSSKIALYMKGQLTTLDLKKLSKPKA